MIPLLAAGAQLDIYQHGTYGYIHTYKKLSTKSSSKSKNSIVQEKGDIPPQKHFKQPPSSTSITSPRENFWKRELEIEQATSISTMQMTVYAGTVSSRQIPQCSHKASTDQSSSPHKSQSPKSTAHHRSFNQRIPLSGCAPSSTHMACKSISRGIEP